MTRWWVTMGDFHSNHGEVLEVAWSPAAGLDATRVATFRPRPERAVHGKGLTGARFAAGWLWVCHFNSIVRMEPRSGLVEIWLEREDFNDLHDLDIRMHADGALRDVLVANTGHDRIERFDAEGRLLERRALHPTPGALRTDPGDAYLREQPHSEPWRRKRLDHVHPNAVRQVGETVFTSRFLDRAIDAFGPDGHIWFTLPGLPHDLAPVDSALWCTTTDGRLWELEPGAQRRAPRLLLDTHFGSGRSGWCRGLSVHGDHVMVGLTRMESMPVDRWCSRPLTDTTTALLLFRRSDWKFLGELSLDDRGAHPKVFAILPCDTQAP